MKALAVFVAIGFVWLGVVVDFGTAVSSVVFGVAVGFGATRTLRWVRA